MLETIWIDFFSIFQFFVYELLKQYKYQHFEVS